MKKTKPHGVAQGGSTVVSSKCCVCGLVWWVVRKMQV